MLFPSTMTFHAHSSSPSFQSKLPRRPGGKKESDSFAIFYFLYGWIDVWMDVCTGAPPLLPHSNNTDKKEERKREGQPVLLTPIGKLHLGDGDGVVVSRHLRYHYHHAAAAESKQHQEGDQKPLPSARWNERRRPHPVFSVAVGRTED
jgi:hypothetical protein